MSNPADATQLINAPRKGGTSFEAALGEMAAWMAGKGYSAERIGANIVRAHRIRELLSEAQPTHIELTDQNGGLRDGN